MDEFLIMMLGLIAVCLVIIIVWILAIIKRRNDDNKIFMGGR